MLVEQMMALIAAIFRLFERILPFASFELIAQESLTSVTAIQTKFDAFSHLC